MVRKVEKLKAKNEQLEKELSKAVQLACNATGDADEALTRLNNLKAENAELTRELHRTQDLIRKLGGIALTGEGDAFAAIEKYWEEELEK